MKGYMKTYFTLSIRSLYSRMVSPVFFDIIGYYKLQLDRLISIGGGLRLKCF